MSLRDRLESKVVFEHVPERHYTTGTHGFDVQRRTVPAHWQYRIDGVVVDQYTGFSTREDAVIDAAHQLLYHAQDRGDAEQYEWLILLVWTMPCPWMWLQRWEDAFRPAPKSTTLRIPNARKAPKQALAWGMDPCLVATAKARYDLVASLASLTRKSPEHYTSSDLSLICDRIRRAGLAVEFGLAPEPEPEFTF